MKTCLACGKVLSQREGEPSSAFMKRKNCNRECSALSRGKERGDKTRYKSRHASEDGSPRWISASQYLAEFMVERQARKEGRELPIRFWTIKPWKGKFSFQLTIANQLLKKFSPGAISKALRSYEGRSVFSLKAPWLQAIIERETTGEKNCVQLSLPEELTGNPSRPSYVFRPSLLSSLEKCQQ